MMRSLTLALVLAACAAVSAGCADAPDAKPGERFGDCRGADGDADRCDASLCCAVVDCKPPANTTPACSSGATTSQVCVAQEDSESARCE